MPASALEFSRESRIRRAAQGILRNPRIPIIPYQYRNGTMSRFNDFADSANQTVLRLAARRSRVPDSIFGPAGIIALGCASWLNELAKISVLFFNLTIFLVNAII